MADQDAQYQAFLSWRGVESPCQKCSGSGVRRPCSRTQDSGGACEVGEVDRWEERAREVSKVIRDGKVAVLYSPGFGAGWSTWATEHADFMLFDPDLVAAVESKDFRLAAELAMTRDCYAGGADQLQIEWLPIGTAFRPGARGMTPLAWKPADSTELPEGWEP